MLSRRDVHAAIDPELLALIEGSISPGTTVSTIADGKPNKIEAIEPAGIWIVTERSSQRGNAELVPGWMFNVAWAELTGGRVLDKRDLIKVVKRSSAVCAVLAALPGIKVISSRPIKLQRETASSPDAQPIHWVSPGEPHAD